MIIFKIWYKRQGKFVKDMSEFKERSASGLEENLKKALAELLILFLFGEEEHYIGELSTLLEKRSNGALSIVFPYAAIYRLSQARYLKETEKKSHQMDGLGSITKLQKKGGSI